MRTVSKSGIRSAALTVVALLSFTLSGQSAVLYDSDGFEKPAFAVGTVAGQNGWTVAAGNPSFLTIEGSLVYQGSQALFLQNLPGVRVLARYTLPSAQSTDFWADVYIRPPAVSDIGANFSLNVRDSGGVIQSSVSFSSAGVAGSPYNQLDWNRITIFYDFEGAGNKYYVYLNNALITPTGLAFSGANLRLFDFDWTANASATTSGGGYVDNFVIQTTSPIPEPGVVVLLGLGLLVVLASRKRVRTCR